MAVDKLVDSTQLDADLTSVASAIRSKGGTSGSLVFPSGFVSAVNDLPQMTGDMAWMGKDAQLVSGEFYRKIDTLDNTLYNGWTPSSTAKAIVASVTLGSDSKFVATDVADWAYFIVWECGCDPVYTGTPTQKALPQISRAYMVQEIIRRPGSWATIESVTANTNANQTVYGSSFLRYYGSTTGTSTYTWAASYGLYFGLTAPAISSTTAASPTITPKTPVLNARTSTTYFSATNAGLIDQANTKWWIIGAGIYKARRETLFDGLYRTTARYINEAAPTT